MSHKLDKFYDVKTGIDTRSNKLVMNPNSYRAGTKNNRHSFQNEIIKANGFQRKSTFGFTNLGEVEYRYTDLNTGEAKAQYLAIGSDGNLYKKRFEYLNFSSLGTSTSYSFYYDEVSDTFIFKLNSYAAITVSLTTTMDQLRTSINALGATCTVVDDDGNTVVGSTKLAYYLDCVINQSLSIGRIDTTNSQYWELVPYPSKYISNTIVPFPTSLNYNTDPNYEGVSCVNLNNVCYIADGGFPMKYDGYTVYRAGIPKILAPDESAIGLSDRNYTGFQVTGINRADGGLTTASKYQYIFQLIFIDAQGSEIVGLFDLGIDSLYVNTTLTAGRNAVSINIPAFVPSANFPYYAALVSGDQNISDAGGTINVNSLHNIEAGMTLRIPISNSEISLSGYSYINSKVTSVTRGYFDTATTTNGSAIITGLTSTSNIGVGALVSGTNIPAASTVLNIDSATQITISANATGTGAITLDVGGQLVVEKGSTLAGPYNIQYPFGRQFTEDMSIGIGTNSATIEPFLNQSVTTVSASTSVTTTSTVGLEVGQYVFNSGQIYGNITAINSATVFTIDTPAASSATNNANFYYFLDGYYVENAGIPAGTIVTSQSDNVLTLSANATANLVNSSTDFHNYNTLLIDGQSLNAGFTQELYENKITDVNFVNNFLPPVFYGAAVRIYRTTADTDTFYKLADLAVSPLGGYTFTDTFADAVSTTGLSRLSILDANQGSELPRACKFITEWQNQIIQMGRPLDTSVKDDNYPTYSGALPVNSWGDEITDYTGFLYTEAALCDDQSIYWNDPLTPEGFPVSGLYEFKIQSNFDDSITGGMQNKDAFFAFKERSTGVLVGSLADNTLELELLEDDIGCASHRSIQEVNGSLVWLDAVNGFYSCVAGRLPVHIGYPISDYQKINSLGLNFTKAVSANFRKENLYICAVGTTTFVFDYASEGDSQRNAWYIWDRFNTKSLLATSNDELYLSDGTYGLKMKTTNTKYDLTDHTSAIPWVLNIAWLTQGAPTIDKKPINLWVNSISGDFTLDFKQYANFLDYVVATKAGVSFLAESSAKKLIKVEFKAKVDKMSGVSFGMENNQKNKLVKIQGYEVEYSPEYDSGEPKK